MTSVGGTPPRPVGRLPLVAAPMAGGPSTPRLVRAVAEAGALGFLAGGYKSVDALAGEIAEVRSTTAAFGVNLFAPSPSPIDEAEFRRYARRLQPDADRWGLDLSGAPLVEDDDGWQDKLDLLLADPVPVVSFTFGLPAPADIAALRRAGSEVWLTITSPGEARAAAGAGATALVVQGSDAGGHSGVHDPRRLPAPTRTAELTAAVVAATGLPVIATGGVDGPERVVELLQAGASAVAVGTLLLRTDESGASQTHKDALASPEFSETVMTRAFTGRPARALRNGFLDRHDPGPAGGYPAVHHLTRPLRAAAAAAGDPHGLHLWAGTGFRAASTGPARRVVDQLARLL